MLELDVNDMVFTQFKHSLCMLRYDAKKTHADFFADTRLFHGTTPRIKITSCYSAHNGAAGAQRPGRSGTFGVHNLFFCKRKVVKRKHLEASLVKKLHQETLNFTFWPPNKGQKGKIRTNFPVYPGILLRLPENREIFLLICNISGEILQINRALC